MRAAFLKKAEPRIECQEPPDDRSLDVLTQGQFERDRGLQHPGNGRPEFFERPAQGMLVDTGNSVRSGFT
jgi:hypothetical protein